MEGSEKKADVSAREGADVDGGHMADKGFHHLAIEERNLCVYRVCGALHVQVEIRKDGDETVPKERVSWQFVQKKREDSKLRSRRSTKRAWM